MSLKSDLELEKKLSEIEDYYKNLPWYAKLERVFTGTVRDMKRDVRKEINHRERNTREPDDWKKVFGIFANKIEHLGFGELASYMRGEGMQDYYNSRGSSADSAR